MQKVVITGPYPYLKRDGAGRVEHTTEYNQGMEEAQHRLLWHLFEEVPAIDHCLHIELFREAVDFDSTRPVFPMFSEERDNSGSLLTPEPIQELIRRCTAGAPEWRGKPPPLVCRQGRLWAQGNELNGAEMNDMELVEAARNAQEAMRSRWIEELQDAERFIITRRQRKALAISTVLGSAADLISAMNSRPLLQEVSDTPNQLTP